MRRHDIRGFLLPPEADLRAAMRCIDDNRSGIALIVDAERRLLGTVTDGDIRRAILHETPLTAPVSVLLKRRPAAAPARPVTAPAGTLPEAQLVIMTERGLRQLPLLDADGRVVEVALIQDLAAERHLAVRGVIMAGGLGTRLRPLTAETPKPMLPLGDKPVIEHLVDRLRDAGIHRLSITTHYRAERITKHFGDGSGFGVEVSYMNEDEPLGTAGALQRLRGGGDPLLVVNGDVVTEVDFGAMLAYHREHEAEMTVAVREYDVVVPYGVVETDGPRVRRVVEKPRQRHFIVAGMYVVEPAALEVMPAAGRFDMPDLIARLIARERTVASFPVHEYWRDIGGHDDYARAQSDLAEGRLG